MVKKSDASWRPRNSENRRIPSFAISTLPAPMSSFAPSRRTTKPIRKQGRSFVDSKRFRANADPAFSNQRSTSTFATSWTTAGAGASVGEWQQQVAAVWPAVIALQRPHDDVRDEAVWPRVPAAHDAVAPDAEEDAAAADDDDQPKR